MRVGSSCLSLLVVLSACAVDCAAQVSASAMVLSVEPERCAKSNSNGNPEGVQEKLALLERIWALHVRVDN